MKNTVENFAEAMDKKGNINTIRHICSRGQVCKNLHVTAFGSKLKKLRRQLKN